MSKRLKEVRELPEFIEIQNRAAEIAIELDSLLARAGELVGDGWCAGLTAAHTIYFIPETHHYIDEEDEED